MLLYNLIIINFLKYLFTSNTIISLKSAFLVVPHTTDLKCEVESYLQLQRQQPKEIKFLNRP